MTCISVLLLQFAIVCSTATFAEEDHMKKKHFAKQITNQNSRELSVRTTGEGKIDNDNEGEGGVAEYGGWWKSFRQC